MDTITRPALKPPAPATEITHLVRMSEYPIALCGTDLTGDAETDLLRNPCVVCLDILGGD